jgi:large subunit ribosomal protein L7/L12
MADDEVKKEEETADASTDAKVEEKEVAPEVKPVEKEEVKADDTAISGGEEVEVPEKFKKLVSEVENMSVLELHELVKVLEKKFGVSASAVAVAAPGAGADGDEDESGGLVSVELTDCGAQKIAVIKVVKEVLGLGLKDAKDMVDGAPTVLKQGVKKEEAEELKKKLEEAGGKVTLK